jgi:hypothetical protein
MRVLDELADAFHAARNRSLPRPVVSSIGLEDQFECPVTANRWAAAELGLGCQLPPLNFNQGHWWLPNGLVTIWDLAAHIARCRPDWEPPAVFTPAAWWDAQLFAGVREVLVVVGNLDLDDVVRTARLRADLRLE